MNDNIESAAQAAAGSATIAKAGVGTTGAGGLTMFIAENSATFGFTFGLVGALVAIAGLVSNWYWNKRRFELERDRAFGADNDGANNESSD